MCPLLDDNREECLERLTLRNLTEAIVYCANNHEHCPIYRKLVPDAARRDDSKARRLAS